MRLTQSRPAILFPLYDIVCSERTPVKQRINAQLIAYQFKFQT